MHPTRLIFMEGVIGSGKSTAALYLESVLRQKQIAVRLVPEGGANHPVRLANNLSHPRKPWLDLTVTKFVEKSLERWRAFADEAVSAHNVIVLDGQLFHGNVTDLLMMDADRLLIEAYVAEVSELIAKLNPLVIYLYQNNLEVSLRETCEQRGATWVDYQIGWKLESPYAKRLTLSGQDGLIEFYLTYRTICDDLLVHMPLPQCWIDTTEGDWSKRYQTVIKFIRHTTGDKKFTTADTDLSNNEALKQQLINRIDNERLFVSGLADQYTYARLMDPGACGQWSVKDTVAHITARNQRILSIITLTKQGGKPETLVRHGEGWSTAFQRLNDEAYEATKALSWVEVTASHEIISNKLIQFVETCNSHDLSPLSAIRLGHMSIGQIIKYFICDHTYEHRIALENWLCRSYF